MDLSLSSIDGITFSVHSSYRYQYFAVQFLSHLDRVLLGDFFNNVDGLIQHFDPKNYFDNFFFAVSTKMPKTVEIKQILEEFLEQI